MTCKDVKEISLGEDAFSLCKQDWDQKPEYYQKEFTLIEDAKHFGREQLALKKTENYLEFRSGKEYSPVRMLYDLYVVPKGADLSSNPRDEVVWEGDHCDESPPVRLLSIEDTLIDEARCFREKGYSVERNAISDFSGGSSITKEFLDMPESELIATLFHEDFHDSIPEGFDIKLNESLANVWGFGGVRKYFSLKDETHSHDLRDARAHIEEERRWARDIVAKVESTNASIDNKARLVLDYKYAYAFNEGMALLEELKYDFHSMRAVIDVMPRTAAQGRAFLVDVRNELHKGKDLSEILGIPAREITSGLACGLL